MLCPERWIRRCVRVFLRAYPAGFRQRFGEDLENAYVDCICSAWARGRWARALRSCARAFYHSLRDGGLERMAQLRSGRSETPRSRAASVTSIRRAMDGKMGHLAGETLADLRFGLRSLARSPSYTLIALVTLVLGIGANTAIFSLVHGVLLRPLPYPEPDRIVVLRETNLPRGWSSISLSRDNFWDWKERNRSFDLAALFGRSSVTLTGVDRPRVLSADRVTPDFLPILGGRLALGRSILEADLDPDGPGIVILEHGFWERAFGGDPQILGRSLELDGELTTVVGVMAEGWRPLSQAGTDLILPLRVAPHPQRRGGHWLSGIARLRPGVPLTQAQADLSSIAAALEVEYPDSNAGWGALIIPLDDMLVGASRQQLLLFLGSVALLLLVTCANVANMTLVRTGSRGRELAIRRALGAGRRRVGRQLLAESLLLSSIGGVLGAALAFPILRVLITAWPGTIPRVNEVSIDGPVLLFTAGISVLAGLAFGILPALAREAPGLSLSLRVGLASGTKGSPRGWIRGGLVVSEMALALVLLVGTGLLGRSLLTLMHEDPGFEIGNRLVFSTPLPEERYSTPSEIHAYGDAVIAGLQAIPGVESAAATTLVPIRGGVDTRWQVTFEERPPPRPTELDEIQLYRVSSGYLETMGIPLISGRGLAAEDREGSLPVVVVSEAFARRHYPGESPLGQRIRIGGGEPPLAEIVGVVGDVQGDALGKSSLPQVYEALPQRERMIPSLSFVVRTTTPPLALSSAVAGGVLAIDPDQPLLGIQTLEAVLFDVAAVPRFRAYLLTAFGLTSLLLAAVGVYGVMSHAVAQRSHEFGVRIALGARRRSVLSLVLRGGIPLMALAVVLGLSLAFALSRVLESMLFQVHVRDAGVFTGAPLTLVAVAVLAMLIPAVRATAVDPIRILADDSDVGLSARRRS